MELIIALIIIGCYTWSWSNMPKILKYWTDSDNKDNEKS